MNTGTSDSDTPSNRLKIIPEGTSTRQNTDRSAAGTSSRRRMGRRWRLSTVSGRNHTIAAAMASSTRCMAKGSWNGSGANWMSTPQMPGPRPRPSRTEMDASAELNRRLPGGLASTRNAVQVPKNAPVAAPCMPRAMSSPVRPGSDRMITCAAARVPMAPSSTGRRPIWSENCPSVSMLGTSATT